MFQAVIDFFMEFGIWGLLIHSFIDAIIFPIPAFFLQVPLSVMSPSSALWLATVGFIGSLLGTPIGYLIGRVVGNSILYKLLKEETVEKVTRMFNKNGESAILIGAFTPIPFKVFTILAGCLNFSLGRLIMFAILGRATKFYAVGLLFYLYDRAAEHMLDSLNYAFAGFAVVIAIVVSVVKVRKAKKRKVDMEQNANQDLDIK